MNKSENRFCVYLHIRPDTGAVFYVGIGTRKRAGSRFSRNELWKSIVNKNNGAFSVDYLCEDISRDSACQMEIRLISFYGKRNDRSGILCNMTNGGEGGLRGVKLTEDHKNKLHQSSRGKKRSIETRIRISLALKGKKKSDSHNLANSLAQKRIPVELRFGGYKHKWTSEMAIKGKVSRVKSLGYIIEGVCREHSGVLRFINVSEAGKAMGVNPTSICKAINGITAHCKGYLWRKSYDLTNLDQLIAQL